MFLVLLSSIFAATTGAQGASIPSGSFSSSPSSTPFGLSAWIRHAKFCNNGETSVLASSSSSSPSSTPRQRRVVPSEPAPCSVWFYQGALYDLLNGKHIANVQGIELIRPLAHYDSSSTSTTTSSDRRQLKDSFLKKCGDLQVTNIMREYWKGGNSNRSSSNNEYNPNEEEDVVDVTTAWSRKFFCYHVLLPLDAGNSEQQETTTTTTPTTRRIKTTASPLLDSIRLNHAAPRRKVPPSQAMASYDSIISFLSPSSSSQDRNVEESSVLLLHTEFPNRQTVHGLAHAKLSPPNTLDLNIYTRPAATTTNNKKQQQRQPPPLELQTLLLSLHNSTSSSSASPRIKRSSLIQFGASSQTTLNRFGARETYSYQVQSPSKNSRPVHSSSSSGWFRTRFATTRSNMSTTASTTPPTTAATTVRYTRQGEGPPWYGPHRLCTLELQGQRLDDTNELEALFGQQGGVTSICQTWVQQTLKDWKTQQDQSLHEVEEFRNTGSREEVMHQLRKLPLLSQRTMQEAQWRRKATDQVHLLWQRFSSSLSTQTLRNSLQD